MAGVTGAMMRRRSSSSSSSVEVRARASVAVWDKRFGSGRRSSTTVYAPGQSGSYDWQVMFPDTSKTSWLPARRCPQTATTVLGTTTGKVANGPLYT